MIETTLTELQRYAFKLSSNMNMNTNRSNSVVSGVAGYEAQSSSPAVFVPLTTTMDLKQTTEKPTGTDKKKVIFPCEDVRVKNRRKLEDLKENLFFFCATSILKGISTQNKLSQHRTIGQLQTTQDIKVRMFLVIVYQHYSCLNESS